MLYEGQQGPLYYWSMATIYKVCEGLSLPDRVFLFRLLNVLLASSVIPLSFLIARHVLLDDAAAISVAVLIACMIYSGSVLIPVFIAITLIFFR